MENKPENKAIFMDKDSHGPFGGNAKKTPEGRQSSNPPKKTAAKPAEPPKK